jgi:hypothetical protein
VCEKHKNREDCGETPLLTAPNEVKLLTYQPAPIPFTEEEEATASYRMGVFFEVCVEDDHTKKIYREMAKKRTKEGEKASLYLRYWEETEGLAEQHYRTAFERTPENEKYSKAATRATLRRIYKEATLLIPDNEAYQEIAMLMEKDFDKEELYT